MKKVTRKKIVCLITVFLFLTSVLCACSAQQVGIKKQNSTTTTRHGSTSGTGLQGAGNATNDETEASGGEYTDITTPETDDTIDASIATGSSEYTENVGDFSTNVDGAIADTTQSTSSRQSTNVNSTTTSKENATSTRGTTMSAQESSASTTKSTTGTQITKTTTSKATTTTKHSHKYTKSKTQLQTCEADGYVLYRCSCGDEYKDTLSKTGHKWSSWKTIEEPTASKEGTSQRTCNNCGKGETKTIPKLAPAVVTEAQMAKIRDGFLMLVNYERNKKGIHELSSNSHLNSVAKTRSEEIIDVWSHTRPNGNTFYSLIDRKQYAYIIVGENICMTSHLGDGIYTAADAWTGSDAQIEAAYSWIFYCFKNSPGHYANMISNDFEDCGIGISYQIHEESGIPLFYVSHIFGAK